MSGTLKIALTYDVERNSPPIIKSTGSVYSGLDLMPEVIDIMRAHRATGTWYIAHDTEEQNQIARHFPDLVAAMAAQGEIGSHFHFRENGVVRTDEAYQRQGLTEATRFLRSLGHKVTGFRGGNLYLTPVTLRILEELGYETDSSVLPGHRVVMNDGLAIDHTGRRSCEPYYPREGDPWSGGGNRLLEIPMSAAPIVSFWTPLVSVLVNYIVGISNLVVFDPERAAQRVRIIRAKWPTKNALVVLSAHPYDFLDGRMSAQDKLRNFDRFLALVGAMPGASFATAAEIRSGWAPPDSARCTRADRAPLKLTTGEVRVLRNRLHRRPVAPPHTVS